MQFDSIGIDEAVSFLDAAPDSTFRYVVTPNVDHVVRLRYATDSDVRQAYDRADLCLCDSRVIARLAWLCGVRLPIVPGSDLVAAFVRDRLRRGTRVALVGGDDETFVRLRSILKTTRIVQQKPPMNLINDPVAMGASVQFIIDNPSDLILLAVGSPQQELIAYRAAVSGRATGTAVCVGAAIEFLTERKRRAPVAMQVMGLEWLHRLCSEPRRLWRRYLVRSPRIFMLAARWVWERRQRAKAPS